MLLVLDISVVFDAVDHSVLCKRAQAEFGVSGTVLDWLQSFVTDRSQYIAIGNERSETTILLSMPQGSVLGPLLFALYVSSFDGVGHSEHKFQGEGDRPPTTVGVRKRKSLGYYVALFA